MPPIKPTQSVVKDGRLSRGTIARSDAANPGQNDAPMQRQMLFVAVAANGLDRTALEGLHALRDFLFGGRLFLDERIATFIVTREKRWRGFPAKIAVDALLID